MLQDRCGLALSTSSEAAAAAYREGVDLMLAAWLSARTAAISDSRGSRRTSYFPAQN